MTNEGFGVTLEDHKRHLTRIYTDEILITADFFFIVFDPWTTFQKKINLFFIRFYHMFICFFRVKMPF
jgi:hypothetical protein